VDQVKALDQVERGWINNRVAIAARIPIDSSGGDARRFSFALRKRVGEKDDKFLECAAALFFR
jgi:hypothetical protein